MGSYATYSDMWIDDSAAPANAEFYEDSPAPPVSVVSCGVTQDNYNGYGHTYWVVSTLTSPNRNISGTSYLRLTHIMPTPVLIPPCRMILMISAISQLVQATGCAALTWEETH